MKIVQRGNKQLRVADDRLDSMLKAGYVEIDAKTGKPVAAPAREDGGAMKKEITALKRENKALKAQVKELTEQLDAARKAQTE